jgi:hypothetical protein
MSCRLIVERSITTTAATKACLEAAKILADRHGVEAVPGEHHDQHAHEEVYVAIREASDNARRQLQEFGWRHRDAVKTHETPLHGQDQLV